MSRGATVRPGVTDDRGLAGARERFLAGEPVKSGQVRDTILASWWRSRRWNVAADLYRFKTRRRVCDLRFGLMSWLGQDRGSCPFASCI